MSKSKSKTHQLKAPDLTQRPPRSPRVRLGGIAGLPRMLDKARATIVGKNGEYKFDCPLDKRILSFLGIEAEALKAELTAGKGDGEILAWINANSKTKPSEWEIEQWSSFLEQRGPTSDAETLGYFADMIGKISKTREDIRTWADVLDLDDYVTFGGKA
jgi:uncharacterized protein DUF5069